MRDKIAIPKHLQPITKKWVKNIIDTYEMEEHHFKLLFLAAESWDRVTEARELIQKHGLTFIDKHGQPRARPEINIERDNKILFARLMRELNLSESPDSRPPALKYTGRRQHAI